MPGPDQGIERFDDLVDRHAQRVRQRRDVALKLNRLVLVRHVAPANIGSRKYGAVTADCSFRERPVEPRGGIGGATFKREAPAILGHRFHILRLVGLAGRRTELAP
jgi:hypothetical protein